MYNNLIYFLVVLLVFATYQPVDGPLDLEWTLVGLLGLPIFFGLVARIGFGRLRRLMATGTRIGPPLQRWQTRLSILAIGLYTLNIYVFGLKDFLLGLPGTRSSTFLAGLIGLAYFGLYLVLLWTEAFPAYRVAAGSQLTRGRYVLGQVRFNLPVILPYLLLSGLTDLLALLPWPGVRAWLETPMGDLVMVMSFMFGLVILFPALIGPLWGLVPVPPGPTRSVIEAFCRRHGFTYREIMLWPLHEGEALTAGVMGLVRRWRYILVTRALLELLDQEELEAVLGHELGHVRRHHLLFYLLFFVGYLLLAFAVADLGTWLPLAFDPVLDMAFEAGGQSSNLLSLILGLPALIMMIVYFRFVLGAFMRNFERQADSFSLRLTGTVRGLIGSLEKIALFSGQNRNQPSWHHYSIAERVDFLLNCQEHPVLVPGHDRKVRLMLGAYVLGLTLILCGTLWIKQSSWGRDFERSLAIKTVEAETRRHPGQSEIHRLLGDLYYQGGEPGHAAAAYERALSLAPDDPELLNNLAWTLLTWPESGRREKTRALALAERAARIKPVTHILDTLAEALFLDGRPSEALAAIDRALALAGPRDDVDYYRRQKARFQNQSQAGPTLDREQTP